MSITAEEWEDIYRKIGLLSMEYNEKAKAMTASLERVYETLAGSESVKQLQRLQSALDDPDSQINQTMQRWTYILSKIDFAKIAKMQDGLLRFAEKFEMINVENQIQFPELNYNKLFENSLYNRKFSEACDVAYETARQEAGEPDISKEELENAVKEELKTNSIEEVEIENSKFKETYIKVLKFIWEFIIIQLMVAGLYDIGKVAIGNIIKSSTETNSATVYEINNQNTYVNIIQQTENHYHIYFIDDEGCIVNGYIEKENVDLDFENEEE